MISKIEAEWAAAIASTIFRQLGVAELADQVAGVKYLISLGFADPTRVGNPTVELWRVYDTKCSLNAPSLQCGIAGAVTSWMNYDTITERYMGIPDEIASLLKYGASAS